MSRNTNTPHGEQTIDSSRSEISIRNPILLSRALHGSSQYSDGPSSRLRLRGLTGMDLCSGSRCHHVLRRHMRWPWRTEEDQRCRGDWREIWRWARRRPKDVRQRCGRGIGGICRCEREWGLRHIIVILRQVIIIIIVRELILVFCHDPKRAQRVWWRVGPWRAATIIHIIRLIDLIIHILPNRGTRRWWQ